MEFLLFAVSTLKLDLALICTQACGLDKYFSVSLLDLLKAFDYTDHQHEINIAADAEINRCRSYDSVVIIARRKTLTLPILSR